MDEKEQELLDKVSDGYGPRYEGAYSGAIAMSEHIISILFEFIKINEEDHDPK